ncbi:MAG: SAM-dependent methyltransferase, partial [Paludibacteraceae bacterium]|nr:SAM-dependent methyltransferase [Paludibacteraceae bacterium]
SSEDLPIHAVNLVDGQDPADFCFTLREESQARSPMATQPMQYLFEPSPAVLKAGAYKLPAVRYGLYKLHANTHLYTADTLPEAWPGRAFRIVRQYSMNKKDLSQLRQLQQANITTRNFPVPAEQLRQRLHLKDGGSTCLFATTLADNTHVILHCERV